VPRMRLSMRRITDPRKRGRATCGSSGRNCSGAVAALGRIRRSKNDRTYSRLTTQLHNITDLRIAIGETPDSLSTEVRLDWSYSAVFATVSSRLIHGPRDSETPRTVGVALPDDRT